MTAFDQDIFIKMLLSVSQKDDAALFPKSEHSPYIQSCWKPLIKKKPLTFLSLIGMRSK